MIEVEKIQNSHGSAYAETMLYYAKLLALNCTVKDEDEALNNETAISQRFGDMLISCVEGHLTYEALPYVPKEILSKYIEERSNLDVFVDSDSAFNTHLQSLDEKTRADVFNDVSILAQTVYIDHYDVMHYYINSLDDGWFESRSELYNNCINNTATWEDLYDELPEYTRAKI